MEELIWPVKKKPQQKFMVVGTREQGEPALLTCSGSCGKSEVVWTRHVYDSGSNYVCTACSSRRRWGLCWI